MSQTERQDTIKVHRGRMDSIIVYDVTDQELQELERGGDGGIYLNFALCLASISASFLIAITTTNIPSDRQFDVFVLVTLASGVGATILGLLWWNCRKSVKTVVHSIKARMPLEPVEDKEASSPDSVDKVAE